MESVRAVFGRGRVEEHGGREPRGECATGDEKAGGIERIQEAGDFIEDLVRDGEKACHDGWWLGDADGDGKDVGRSVQPSVSWLVWVSAPFPSLNNEPGSRDSPYLPHWAIAHIRLLQSQRGKFAH